MQCFHVVYALPLSIAPDDYTALNNTTLTFLSGTTRGGPGFRKCINIVISNEELVELDEPFLLTADSLDPDVNITNTATVTIINRDGMWL